MKLAALLTLMLSLAIVFYAFLVEPFWIQVTEQEIGGQVTVPLKIAHITDLHLKQFGRFEVRILSAIELWGPDLIVVTGDSIDDQDNIEYARQFFLRLRSPLGTWMVRGNWENWAPVDDEKSFWQSVNVHFIVNEKVKVREDVEILGFDDELSGKPDRSITATEVVPFHLCLFHSPVFFDSVANRCDLALAGHTHGGQIWLPLMGPLWVPPGSGNYLAGWYQRQNSRMYVSRGLGSPILRVRFLSRPELHLVTILNGG